MKINLDILGLLTYKQIINPKNWIALFDIVSISKAFPKYDE